MFLRHFFQKMKWEGGFLFFTFVNKKLEKQYIWVISRNFQVLLCVVTNQQTKNGGNLRSN